MHFEEATHFVDFLLVRRVDGFLAGFQRDQRVVEFERLVPGLHVGRDFAFWEVRVHFDALQLAHIHATARSKGFDCLCLGGHASLIPCTKNVKEISHKNHDKKEAKC